MDLIWIWFGSDLDLIWIWFGSDLDLIWIWFGSDLDLITTKSYPDLRLKVLILFIFILTPHYLNPTRLCPIQMQCSMFQDQVLFIFILTPKAQLDLVLFRFKVQSITHDFAKQYHICKMKSKFSKDSWTFEFEKYKRVFL